MTSIKTIKPLPTLRDLTPLISSSMSPDLLALSATLYHRSASVRAVKNRMDDQNRFTVTFHALDQLARENDLPIAIVGGLGAIHFGYPATTEDIDVAIASDQLQTLLDVAPQFGFRIAWRAETGLHTLTLSDVEINVVPEGRRARNDSPTTIPSPKQLGVSQGLDYANIEGWMELKISSGRRKDLTHVIEVLKKCDGIAVEKVRQHLAAIHPSYLSTFNQLANEAIQESQQEDQRSRSRGTKI